MIADRPAHGAGGALNAYKWPERRNLCTMRRRDSTGDAQRASIWHRTMPASGGAYGMVSQSCQKQAPERRRLRCNVPGIADAVEIGRQRPAIHMIE